MIQPSVSSNIFSQYIQKQGLFTDKKILSSSFVPEKIEHREAEIQQISSIIAPVLRGYKPNNIFIYGTCGTGKTICTKYVVKQLLEAAQGNGQRLITIYLNCKMKKVADTEYRLFAQMLRDLGEFVPDTGLPTDVIYRRFFERVEQLHATVLIILDEIDTLVKKVGDEFLYNLTRVNSDLQQSSITTIGITNDLLFLENLDLRVKSSLSEEEVMFKPYNAIQLKDILTERVKHGFRDGVVKETVIAKCAALAAQEHGDARRALDLLRVAGELAERSNDLNVNETYVDVARKKIDMDRVSETIKSQPTHSQLVLYAIVKTQEKQKLQKEWADHRILTGDVSDVYTNLCETNGIKPLTQRRVSDLIGELDMLGIINAKVISKGRHGRTREIRIALNENVLANVERLLIERFGN
ncbi:MAG: orc1/cdc6 family replication initiation protein [Candidatus Aenigmarchaeota archaeon]|nr:orc1/cdc6 family replication initiation protein [Candidatus Aenigmarchaeota archaeon]